jgi:hypothetical protein
MSYSNIGAAASAVPSSGFTSNLAVSVEKQQLISPASGTPITCGSDANFLADSLGVSPLYRQQDSQVN